ncbi:hypothetical protein FQR65_LT11507 [Abscondita terminalis]|nr:hypothetical protein FQR65_LT11507 [Abscondita terminalis]
MCETSKDEQPKLKFMETLEEVNLEIARDLPAEKELTNIDEKVLLDPDHPLLAPFQRTLKRHLENQIEHLKKEVFELENGAKKKSAMREQLGLETYENQQIVNKQQRELEICVQELDHICAATEELEIELEEATKLFAEKRVQVLECEKKELHLQTEVESLNLMLNQMTSWENEMESDLTVKQRVYEKTQKERRRLVTEKRELDAFVYKLMTDTWRLEEELNTMDMQIRAKEEEREALAEAVVTSNIDLETIATEHRCLMHSWNSLVVAISLRDKSYTVSKDELSNLHDTLRMTVAQLARTKQLCEKEMETNEKLTMFKQRLQADIDTTTCNIQSEKNKQECLTMEIDNILRMMSQTEADLKMKIAENALKNQEFILLTRDLENLTREKVQLDEKILAMLESEMTNNKTAKYLNRLVREVKETNRKNEIMLTKLENSNAKALMDIEVQKCSNIELQQFLDQAVKQLNNTEGELKALEEEDEKLKFFITKKQRTIDLLSNKLDAIVNKQGGVEASPQELKLITLEKNIAEIEDTTRKLQKFWLREQAFVVNLSHQRQEQINDLSMIKKQLQLLQQKNLRINDELNDYQEKEDKLNRAIVTLQNRILICNEQIIKKKGSKNSIEKDTDLIQFDFSGKLQVLIFNRLAISHNLFKDAEMESVKLQSDITDIEEDKVTLSNDLVDLNREALAWEKKIKMATETKKEIEEERSAGGEVGNMKAEIHRMQVRYGQLKRAQDKLIQDLDHCVSRRDSLLNTVEAREKKEKGACEKTRITFLRKMWDMRNRLKQMQDEMQSLNNKIEAADEEERRLITEITITQQDVDYARRKTENINEIIEETKTDRQRVRPFLKYTIRNSYC